MTRILGIDPGSRITGYGIIDVEGRDSHYVASGHLRVGGETLAERLGCIFSALRELSVEHRPQQMAIERVFMHRNADSALKLGHARGAAICAVQTEGIAVTEYSAREIKQAVVGKGNAAKEQVQHMVRLLLGLRDELQADEADALAVAVCHSHASQTLNRIPGVRRARGGRLS